MLTVDPIARVTVTVAQAAEPEPFDTGLILCPSAEFTAGERYRTYLSLTELAEDGYTDADAVYKAAALYFAASPPPLRLAVSRYPDTESPAEALDAALAESADFYAVYACGADAEGIAGLAARVTALTEPCVLFYPVIGSVADALSSGGLFAALKTAGSDRVFGLYCAAAEDAAALMGLAMGLSRDGDGAFALCYKKLNGVTPVSLTEAQATALKELNANIYVTRAGRDMLETGAAASGRRFDETRSLDRIAAALRAAAVELITDGAGALPQTDGTSAVFINRFSAVLSGFTASGVLATGAWRGDAVGPLSPGDPVENGYALWADPCAEQSEADRAAHRAAPVHAALTLAGSVESAVITVGVTI